MLAVGGMIALALPLVVEVAGEISPRVASRFFFLGVVKSGLVVELTGFPVVKKRECHSFEFCLAKIRFFQLLMCLVANYNLRKAQKNSGSSYRCPKPLTYVRQ